MLSTVQAWEPATGRLLQAAVAASLPAAPELRDGGCEAFPNIRLF
jgi:hypothetical protein